MITSFVLVNGLYSHSASILLAKHLSEMEESVSEMYREKRGNDLTCEKPVYEVV